MTLFPDKVILSLGIIAFLVFLPVKTTSSESSLDADDVAQKVARQAGDPYDVQKLAFTFVVRKNGDEVLARRHQWYPKQGRLRIDTAEKSIRFRDIGEYELTKLAKAPEKRGDVWDEIAPSASPQDAARAWEWFINDSYWLLAPSKVTDKGVITSLDESERLVLDFEGVGITPGDTYKLTIDRQSWRVTRRSFELQSGRTGTFSWVEYEQIGPLTLSTRRISRTGDVEILFKDVVVEP